MLQRVRERLRGGRNWICNVELQCLGDEGKGNLCSLDRLQQCIILFLDMNQSQLGPTSTRYGGENGLSASV